MSDETEAGAKAPDKEAPKQPRNDDPGLVAAVFERTTRTNQDAFSARGEIVPRSRLRFDVDGEICAPGLFVGPDGQPYVFTVTLAALTSGQELAATRGVQDPAEAVHLLARASMEAVNGAPLAEDQREFFWEALGPGGRQLVITMYGQIGGLNPQSMGKALASCSRF